MSKESEMERDIKELKEAVKELIALEKMRTEAAIKQNQPETKDEPEINVEELKEDLKEVHLGELVIYALKNNLIKRKDQ